MNNTFLETIKILDGKIFNIDYHQKRYESVLQTFKISKFKNLKDYINPPSEGLYRCRVIYSTKNIEVQYIPYIKKDIKKLKIVYDNDIEYSKKSTCRDELNELYKQREDADDIIIVKNSLITDTSIANIALYDGEVWHTPKKPLLFGTTRQRYLDNAKLIQSDITEMELFKYKKIALLNAIIDFDIISSENIKDVIC